MVVNPEESKVSDKVGFTILPSVEGVLGREHAAIKSGNMVAIYGLSKNKAVSYKVLELAFSKHIQKKIYVEKYAPYGWIPSRLTVLKDPEVTEVAPWTAKDFDMLLDPNIYYFSFPALPEYFRAMDIAANALAEALAGETDVTTAFNNAQEELVKFFKDSGL